MPTPRKKEPKKKFIKRCIPYMFHNEPDTLTSTDKKGKQAYAICNSIYDKSKKNEIVIFSNFVTESLSEEMIFDGIKGKLSIGRDDNGDYYVNFLIASWKQLGEENEETLETEIGDYIQKKFNFTKKPFIDIDNPAAGYSFKLYDYEVRDLLMRLLR